MLRRAAVQEVGGTLEQAPRCPDVVARVRLPPRLGEVGARTYRQVGPFEAELRAVAHCLFEVVPDDLVELDQSAAPLQPGGESSWSSARVAFGSASYAASRISRWRNRYASSPASVARSGRISSLRTRPTRFRVDIVAAVRCQLAHGPAMEHLALDRAALDHRTLVGAEPVEAGLQQRLDRGRHLDASTLAARARPSPRRTTGCRSDVASTRSRDLRREPVTELARAAPRIRRSQRLEQHGRRVQLAAPPAGRTSNSSGRARQRSRIGAPRDRSATWSTRSRKAAPPVDVVEDDDRAVVRGMRPRARARIARWSSRGVAAPTAISSDDRVRGRAASAPRSPASR